MNNTQKINKLNKELAAVKQKLEKQEPTENFKLAWMNTKETGYELGMCERTLRRLRQCGALPFSRVHGKIYYKRSDVQKMLDKNYKTMNKPCGCPNH